MEAKKRVDREKKIKRALEIGLHKKKIIEKSEKEKNEDKKVKVKALVLDNIISKDLILKSNVESIDSTVLIDLISEGKVIFNKSEPNQKPCGVYYIETNSLNFIITNCEDAATVEIN